MKKTIFIAFLLFICCSTFTEIKYHITVAQDNSGDYTSIQDAIDATKAFPDKLITVFVKNGTYHEKVKIHLWNTLLTIKGESRNKTIITSDDFFDKINRGRNSTFFTYTMLVDADDCILENLSIINSAGNVGQAVALHIQGDKCNIKNCTISGNQDTLYASGSHSRQYFQNCLIEGTTDSIFGNATAIFSDFIIHSKANSYVTAASTDEGRAFGLVFINCKLTADKQINKAYLGRPWRPYAQTIFIGCEMNEHVTPEGWHDWHNTAEAKTSFYAEYNCTGKGFCPEKRVTWSHQLKKRIAKKYTIDNIFEDWKPM